MTRQSITAADLQPGDVLRARRFGCRKAHNYVIDGPAGISDIMADLVDGAIAVEAHREYGAGRPTYMVFDPQGAYIIRSYR